MRWPLQPAGAVVGLCLTGRDSGTTSSSSSVPRDGSAGAKCHPARGCTLLLVVLGLLCDSLPGAHGVDGRHLRDRVGASFGPATDPASAATATATLGAAACNRNGVVGAGGGCVCDSAWSGLHDCSQLAVLPANPANLGAIYPPTRNTSSWGGTVTKGADGLWHLLVSEMAEGCGLATWQRNSFIRHATSPTVDGTYTPHERVLDVFSHNAACMDASPAGGPKCVLLHVGTGTHDETKRPVQTNCTGGYTPHGSRGVLVRPGSHDQGRNRSWRGHQSATPTTFAVPTRKAFAVGEQWGNATLAFGADAAGVITGGISNPGGWVDSDGTAWLVYVLRGDHGKAGRGGYGMGLAKASGWAGPYTPVATDGALGFWDAPVLPSAGTPQANCEDPTLYRDTRGDFHMIFHYFGLGGDHGDHGGHAHAAANGSGWVFSPGHAYELAVSFGATITPAVYDYRQRPHVLLSSAGAITHLITGVVFDSSRKYPAECKSATGIRAPCDRSWTSFQPVVTP
eukprot:m.422220 g.422220  ORF g.422220 m.422220 type:complete len:511 (+) comp36686_c0_seq1:169-1701(+)